MTWTAEALRERLVEAGWMAVVDVVADVEDWYLMRDEACDD